MDDGQLVAERDDFQVQRGARLDDTSQRVEQREEDDGRHDCRLSENARNLNRRNSYEVLGRHNTTTTGWNLSRREFLRSTSAAVSSHRWDTESDC
jgi:hypothetical protein